MRRLILFLPLPLLAAACTAVGPDYKRPATPGEAAAWVSSANTAPAELSPWAALGDPVLSDLIDKAIAANLDIAEAEAKLREARAQRGVTGSRTLPSASLNGAAQQTQVSLNGQFPAANIPRFDRNFSLFDAGFDASWEIDLWGGVRRAVQSADRQIDAARARAADVRLQTVAEVVRTYAQLRGSQAALANVRADAQSAADTARIVHQRFQAGEAARFDDARAEEQARTAAAAIPGLEADMRAAAFKLALLTARAPDAVTGLIETPTPLPALPANVAVGLRADMLRRRPDIRAAEADLAAATANIGAETANLYPRLSLTGGVNQQSRRPGDLVSNDSLGFSVGPRLSWAIFDAGKVRAQIRAAGARADGATARYTKAVLAALADSETAINRYAAATASVRERDAARAASQISLGLARQRYQAGEDDLLALLAAQTAYSNADRAAAAARQAALETYATLVKALGGGWLDAPEESR
ncbi:efflux transporter outer membrane subunit [Novosphingobium sp. Chol11]|uniref:efflux transporter outer membrane subunit n=1 Tax=Novosphingobium sp. Chol11 TaxID=1385763 RepID=UPI0025D11564|nr:efflux transporter outer membrane subunit [Novosphingobium sp. Chol11]